ncbi:MAG: hypothetical protein WAU42_01090 [Solirubrobacteraceae bacterium]
MVLGNIVIWGLILTFMVWLVMDWRSRRHHREMTSSPSAGEILDRRLASGEITTDEHDRIRKALGARPHESNHPE